MNKISLVSDGLVQPNATDALTLELQA